MLFFSLSSFTVSAQLQVDDSTMTIFNDPGYKLTLHIFEVDSSDEGQNNSALILNQFIGSARTIIFKGSLLCTHPWIQFKDTSGARSNFSQKFTLVNGLAIGDTRLTDIIPGCW